MKLVSRFALFVSTLALGTSVLVISSCGGRKFNRPEDFAANFEGLNNDSQVKTARNNSYTLTCKEHIPSDSPRSPLSVVINLSSIDAKTATVKIGYGNLFFINMTLGLESLPGARNPLSYKYKALVRVDGTSDSTLEFDIVKSDPLTGSASLGNNLSSTNMKCEVSQK